MPDVLHELSAQVGQRREDAAGNDVALDLGEPKFDLVEPRGVGRGEVQVNLRMPIQKVVDLARLMGREIVRNHVDFFAARLVDDDVRQKGDELRGRVSRGRLAEYLAGLGVGESGNTGSLRSSAWIVVFSSTEKTAACAGGLRYNPMMSAAFCSNSGSLVAM